MHFGGKVILDIINTLNNLIWSQYVLIPLLLLTGLFFTIKTRGLQVRMLPQMFKSIVEKPDETDEKSISPFQAFAVGLASRVGTGNLSGVAIAIVVGGPGSVFWMWIVAILGSVSAFVESTLAQVYKVRDEEVSFRGGPAYYMRDALNCKTIGVIFALLLSVVYGLIFNAVQANTITNATLKTFNIQNTEMYSIYIGLVIVGLVGYVLFGGTKRIAEYSSIIVPVMAAIYLVLAAIVIILRIDQIPAVFMMIIQDAFDFNAAIGGAIGMTITMGIKRGLFSNEAGMGSAPNAAASATTSHPAKQGLIQSLGVYIDTLVVCSATAFIILSSGIELDPSATDGISVTMDAMASVIGDWSIAILMVAIFFLAFSSILGNYYYAQSNIEFIKNNPVIINVFKVFLLIVVFWGSIASSDIVWTLADLFMGMMAIINIIAILLLSKKALIVLKDYEKQLKKGENPVFNSKEYQEFKDLDIWHQEK